MNHTKLMEMTKISLCVALLCVSAFLVIPIPFTPVMITAQTVIVTLVALLLTPAQSAAAVGIYLLIGVCGVPVFAGGTGGIAHLLGPTGGFCFGFLAASPLISWLKGKQNRLPRYLVVSIAVGIPVIYLSGTVMLCLVGHMGVPQALAAGVAPFVVGDVLKCVGACLIAVPLNKALAHQGVSA